MNDDEYTITSGYLEVGDGHTIYYQEWGNKQLVPTFHLHGGPGSGNKDKNKLNFDPKRHHIIFHDQRGCGKSTPFAELKGNTTQALVQDIEKLRSFFGFDKIQLTGGSWGSTLALMYAITYPQYVSKMLLNGIFTGTKLETDYISQGGLQTHFPDAWERYIELVPKDKRHDTARYYYEKMLHGTPTEVTEHISRWNLLEGSATSIDSDLDKTALETKEPDDYAKSIAILEAHYFIHNCFIEDNYIFLNAERLKSMETIIVHGRYDHVCPPETAFRLSKLIGESCHLQLVPSSHAREGSGREVMKAYAWSFLGK